MISSTSIAGPGSKYSSVSELAFVGNLDTVNGLKIFCEAIDNVAAELGKAGVSVSFVGIQKTVDNVPSAEWIDIYAGNWEEYGLKWNLVTAEDPSEILQYLSQSPGRIAVMPSLFDPSSIIGQELLYSGFPFIASNESALSSMIMPEYRQQALVAPNTKELTKRFKDIINNQGRYIYSITVPIARPAGFKSTSVESWLDLHTKLVHDVAPTCVRKYEESKEFPLVSVVLVHHNRGNLLKQAIESIESQTYPNIEVVLVDDGSTDKDAIKLLEELTWGWWEDKGWKVIREKNKYLGAARNTGVKHSVGKYVVFMDDDDIAKPHQVETLVKVAINRDAEVVTSGHDVFTGMHKPFTAKSQKRYLPIGPAKLAGMLENVFGDSKMLVNRESFISAGGFTEDYGVGFEDYEFLAKIALGDKNIEAVSEPLNWYRRHNEAMSYQTNLKANQLRMLRAYVQVNDNAPKVQQALLQFTQETFFNRHGVRAFEFDAFPQNFSMTFIQPSATEQSATYMPTISFVAPYESFTKELETLTTQQATMTQASSQSASPTPTCAPGVCCPKVFLDCSGKCPQDHGYGWKVDCNGKCMPPSKGAHDGQCGFSIRSTEPLIIPNTLGEVFSIIGYRLESLTGITINGVKVDRFVINSNQMMTVTLPEVILPNPSAGSVGTAMISATNGTVTTSTTIQFYDPSKSTINSISPRKAYVNEVQKYEITGSNILRGLADPVCVFYFPETGMSSMSNLTVVSSSLATCSGSFDQDGDATINVMYSRPKYPTLKYTSASIAYRPEYFVWGTGSSSRADLPVKVYQRGPIPTFAQFDPTGAAILVDFSIPIAVVDPTVFKSSGTSADSELYNATGSVYALSVNGLYCSAVFLNNRAIGAQLWRDGSESDCTITLVQATRLKLVFNGEFTLSNAPGIGPIVPGSSIAVQQYSITALGSKYSDASFGSLTALSPVTKPQPKVTVIAASLIGACVSYDMDLSASYGSAGRNWQNIKITYTSTQRNNASISRADKEAYAMIDGNITMQVSDLISGSATSLVLQKEILPEDNYTFNVTFTNFLGGSNSALVYLKKLNLVDVPYIVLTSDNGNADLDVSAVQILRASNIPIIGCGPQTKVNYNWSRDVITTAKAKSNLQFTDDALTKSALVVQAFQLIPKVSYQFQVVAQFNWSDAFPITHPYNFSVQIASGNDQIFANAGPSRTIGILNKIIMSASILDTSYVTIDPNMFQCTWTCIDTNKPTGSNACISSDSGNPITSYMTSCNMNDLTGHLKQSLYKFFVTVKNVDTGNQVAGDPSFLNVVAGKVPLVTLVASELTPGSYSETFNIQAVVDPNTADPANIDYQWSTPSSCYGTNYLTIGLTQGVTTLTSPAAANLMFVPGQLTPSGTYCMSLTVTDRTNSGGNSGSSALVVKIRDAPFGGVCKAIQTAGSAFTDNFSFQCSGWVTDALSYPLNYKFYISPSSEQSWSLVGPQQASSQFSVKLAAGNFTVLSQVVDNAFSVNLIEQLSPPIIVVGASLQKRGISLAKRTSTSQDNSNCQTANDYIIAQMNTFDQTSNAISAISAMAIGVSAIPIDPITKSVDLTQPNCENLQNSIVSFLQDVLNSGNWYLDPVRAAPLSASIFEGTVSRDVYSTKVISEVLFDLLKNTTTDILTNIAQSPIKTCYNSATASKYLSVLEVVVGSLHNSNSFSTKVGDSWSSALGQINTCQQNVRICGQLPYQYSGNFLNYEVGNEDLTAINDTAKFCGGNFTLTSVKEAISTGDGLNGCHRYTCQLLNIDGLTSVNHLITLNNDKLNKNISTKIASLTFANNADNTDKNVTVSSGGAIYGQIYLDQNLIDQYSLSKYNPNDTAKRPFVLVPVQLLYTDSQHKYSGLNYTTDGMKIVNTVLQSNTVQFTASQAGSYAILIQDNVGQTVIVSPPPSGPSGGTGDNPTPSQTPTSGAGNGTSGSNTGAIVGGVVGAAVAAIIVAGAIFAIRRRKQKQSTPKVALTPPTAAVAVASGEAVVIDMAPAAATVRTKDPAALPNYQMPPTYDEFMVAKADGRENMFGPQSDNDFAQNDPAEREHNETLGISNASASRPEIEPNVDASPVVPDETPNEM